MSASDYEKMAQDMIASMGNYPDWSEAKHTEGPWRWWEDQHHEEFLSGQTAEVCRFGSEAGNGGFYPSAGEAPWGADKRLIEAAPRLLKLLYDVVPHPLRTKDHEESGASRVPVFLDLEWADEARELLTMVIKGEPYRAPE